MDTELQKELIRITLKFIYNALNGIKENESDYYITVYNYFDSLDVYLHNIKTLKCYRVFLSCNGVIEVETVP